MTIETVKFGETEYQYETLGNYSGPELVKIYNAASKASGGIETKRFPDKASALKRTWSALQAAAKGTDATIASAPSEQAKAKAEPKPAKEKKAKAEKPAKEKSERPTRRMYFNFPARAVSEQKTINKESMRGKIFQLLSREYGATFDQLFNATWGNAEVRSIAGCDDMAPETQRKTTYEATRLIHYFNGFGLYHDEKDHIHVFSTAAEKAELKEKHPPKHDTNGK